MLGQAGSLLVHAWAKCMAYICIVLLLPAAAAVDLCTKGLDAEAFNSSYQRDVIPNGGIPAPELTDSLALTPLACATDCCVRSSCNAFFFFNETCFLITCRPSVLDDCTSSPSDGDQFTGSYWLLVRDPTDVPSASESNVTSASLLATSVSLYSTSTSPPLSVAMPTSMLAPECNGSQCGANEMCAKMTVDAVTKYYCTCLTGYHRNESTKSCVQDVSLSSAVSTVSTKSVTNAFDGIHTALLSTVTPTPAVAPVETLTVSAGEERTIRWPQNQITVNAYVLPESSKDVYRYQWSLFAHPDGTETGEMVDINSASVKLSKLRIGAYTFKVTVSADGKYGESYVNVTLLPPERENRGPIAVAVPNQQEITQPNDLIIDGSGSTDDDKIVRYHWEQVSGPLDSLTNIDTSDLDKPTLVLKGLGPGSYRFKLTVTDSDGVQNDTYADAVVTKETDYPPKANAGSNIVINLPQTSVILMGNASQDDKGIVRYEWTKKSDDTADMMGVRTPFLQLSNLQVGDYTFTLMVTDIAKQTSSADVRVLVKPEHNQPPVSRASSDRVVSLPIERLILDGSNSTDDQKIVSYSWSLLSGPNTPVIGNSDQAVATVSKVIVGDYKFQLVVRDNEGLESTSQTVVTVKENPNLPPVAKAGGDRVVVLPAPLVIINGSASSDDKGIVSYLWVRDKSSPAAGDVVPSSDHQVVLQLVNVVPGRYKFTLTVADVEELESHDSMTLLVEPDPYKLNLVELYLSVDVMSFSETNQQTLKDQLLLLLRKSSSSGELKIIIRSASEEISTGRTLVIFYVDSAEKGRHEPWPAREVVNALKKLRSNLDILDIQIVKFEPSVCENNCSGHGVCDQTTKLCICDGFWMEDFFKAYFGAQETNCDWSILYVVIIVFFGVIVLGASFWVLICYCKRYRCSYLKPKLKRHRYLGVESQSDDSFKSNEKMELIPKVRSTQNSSVMQSESEFSSEELLFVNSKRSTNGFAKKLNNGSAVSGAKPKTAA